MAVAVRARFPKLAAALGDQLFEGMLASFINGDPDVARSLTESKRRLPEFLASTAAYPVWYAELASLDRAHVDVLHAPAVATLTRRELTSERELKLIPAHALVHLTTTVDELWLTLDDAAAAHRKAHATKPRSLDWPRTVLIWRTTGSVIRDRTIDLDESSALKAAVRGTSLVELAAGLGGSNPHARALDLVVRWLDEGVLIANDNATSR